MIGIFTVAGQMVVEDCCNCHIKFAMTSELYRSRYNDHGSFYCPNGHGQHYTVESDKTRLERELRFANNAKESAQREARRVQTKLNATKGVVTRIKNRIQNGVCPHCNRHFANVHAHMKTKHAVVI